MLLALALAACDSTPPTAGIVESDARITPTPVPAATPISTLTPIPDRNLNAQGHSRIPDGADLARNGPGSAGRPL